LRATSVLPEITRGVRASSISTESASSISAKCNPRMRSTAPGPSAERRSTLRRRLPGLRRSTMRSRR